MRVVLLVGVILLAGCQLAFHQDYSGEDAATLVFSSDDLPAQPVICVPGEGFRDTRIAVGRGGMKMLDDLNEAMKKSPEVEVSIPAGRDVIAGFRHRSLERPGDRDGCRQAVRLSPSANARYRLHLEDGDRCLISTSQWQNEQWQPLAAETVAWDCP